MEGLADAEELLFARRRPAGAPLARFEARGNFALVRELGPDVVRAVPVHKPRIHEPRGETVRNLAALRHAPASGKNHAPLMKHIA